MLVRSADSARKVSDIVGRSTLDIEQGHALADETGFPPYDIAVTGEDAYRITMAVAGFIVARP